MRSGVVDSEAGKDIQYFIIRHFEEGKWRRARSRCDRRTGAIYERRSVGWARVGSEPKLESIVRSLRRYM